MHTFNPHHSCECSFDTFTGLSFIALLIIGRYLYPLSITFVRIVLLKISFLEYSWETGVSRNPVIGYWSHWLLGYDLVMLRILVVTSWILLVIQISTKFLSIFFLVFLFIIYWLCCLLKDFALIIFLVWVKWIAGCLKYFLVVTLILFLDRCCVIGFWFLCE